MQTFAYAFRLALIATAREIRPNTYGRFVFVPIRMLGASDPNRDPDTAAMITL